MTSQLIRNRIFLFQIVVLISFAMLTVQLWRLQVLDSENYQLLSTENRIAFEDIDAPRLVRGQFPLQVFHFEIFDLSRKLLDVLKDIANSHGSSSLVS